MEMPGRKFSSDKYRFGFNGMEKDDDMYNVSGTSYDFGARLYSSRLGRWLATDPMEGKYPKLSPYNAFNNNPVIYVDPDGRIYRIHYEVKNSETGKTTLHHVDFDGVSAKNDDGTDYAMGRNQFVDDVINSYNYIVDNDADVDDVLKTIASDKENVVDVRHSRNTIYTVGKKRLRYNSTEGLDVTNREGEGFQSPAIGFYHESYHAYIEFYFTDEQKKDFIRKSNSANDELEEAYIIAKEKDVIDILNKKGEDETYREGHSEGQIEEHTEGPTSNDPVNKRDGKKNFKNRDVTKD